MAADRVEPLGEARADMRAARNTVAIIGAVLPGMDAAGLASQASYLRNYLQINNRDDAVLTPEEAAEYRRRKSEG